MLHDRKLNARLTATARKVRTKKRKFSDAKKEAIKGIKSLISAVKAAEHRLREKAADASRAVERFNQVSDYGSIYNHNDGLESGRHNPRMQTDIDFDSVIEALTGHLETAIELTE